jgi:hypothetical protein
LARLSVKKTPQTIKMRVSNNEIIKTLFPLFILLSIETS